MGAGPPPEEERTGRMLVAAALAGGIASCCSTLLLHPIDTIKTRVQSTPGLTFGAAARSLPSIGTPAL